MIEAADNTEHSDVDLTESDVGKVDLAGKDMFGLTALHKFCSWNNTTLTAALLRRLSAADVNAVDSDGHTALAKACEMGAFTCVRMLLENEACDVTICDKRGRTAADITKQTAEGADAVELAALFEKRLLK
jgi:ankyrin repeat protein